jgi:hypothetical protein
MTDSPIKLRADVSPTCRGSTGLRHNGWNPAPLVPPSRIVLQSVTLNHVLDHDVCGVDIHGWKPERSGQPTNARTCGVVHALYRCIVPRSCSSWPWRGLPDRCARRRRRSSDSLLSSPHRTVGRVRRGLQFRNWGLGLLASPSPAAGGEGTSCPASDGFGSSPHVRPCPQGRIAPGGGPFAPASGFGPRRCPGLVLFGRRSRGSSSSGSCRESALSRNRPAESGRGKVGCRSDCFRPVHSALLDFPRRPISRCGRRFTNVPFSSFGGSRP